MMELVTAMVTTVGGGLIGAVSTVYVTRKKYDLYLRQKEAEAETQEQSNVQIYVAANQAMMDDMRQRIEELVISNRLMRHEFAEFKRKWPCQDCRNPL